jgi:DNA-binding transcriptional LysR family regulator
MDPLVLRKIDLQLLEQLEVLISERHVTRAAERMGLGQPAMSGVLAKLREIIGDPLLVRTPQGMVPTARALEVASQVREGLQLIRGALSQPAQFDPAVTVRQFRIVAPDSIAFALLPLLLAHFEAHAPGITTVFEPADVRLSRELLEANTCDLMIAYLPSPPEGLHATTLFEQKLCTIVREGHPEIRGSLSIEQFVTWPHLVFGAGATPFSTIESVVDRALRGLGLHRRIGARVSNILLIPNAVAATNMIATVSERNARNFLPIAPVQVLPPPLDLPNPAIAMLWHDRTHRDPAHHWLRTLIRRSAAAI